MFLDPLNEEVYAIASDIFMALIDRDEGILQEWWDAPVPFENPMYSWVDMTGNDATRVLVGTEKETAEDIVRCMTFLDPGEEVDPEVLTDAFGEVANVLGGNLKSLLPDPGDLTLPKVEPTPPAAEGATLTGEVLMNWRGKLVTVSTWGLQTANNEG